MSHHSDGPGPKLTDENIKRFFLRGKNAQVDMSRRRGKLQEQIHIDKILNLGPTGEFPHGKLTVDDEGQIQFSVGIKDDKVIMDFGTPVRWIGMTADDAREVGKTLIKHAKKINRR